MPASQRISRTVNALGSVMHKTLKIRRWLTLAVVFLSLMGLRVAAQSGNARVAGRVDDTTGAAIPGATITLTNTDTNAVSKVTSSANGDFTINALPIGNYHAKVEMAGFASQEQDLKLDVGAAQIAEFLAQCRVGFDHDRSEWRRSKCRSGELGYGRSNYRSRVVGSPAERP